MMEVGQTLGRYEIRGVLGRGAMGVVYDGFDPVIGRRVAIKTVVLPGQEDTEAIEATARFRRESQAAGRLTHPNIVGVFDYGESGDVAYIVMEFVDGPTLKSLLDGQERFSTASVQRIMADVLAGLKFSHGRGVVHRDIKPANIMLAEDGQAKIADFGIARIESSSMTQVGTVLGTPAYMSPEQFRGEVADLRTDIYSAGVLLYQLLTGDRPFDGGFSTIMHKALNTEPPRPSAIAVTVPTALDAVVLRAMAKRPEDRFASAGAFAEAIQTAMQAASEGTVVLRRPPPAPIAPPPPDGGRNRLLPLAVAVGCVVLAGIGGGAWLLHRPPTPIVAPVSPPPAVPPPAAAPLSAPPATAPAAAPPVTAQPTTAPPATAPPATAPPTTAPPATALPVTAPPVPAESKPAPEPTKLRPSSAVPLPALQQAVPPSRPAGLPVVPAAPEKLAGIVPPAIRPTPVVSEAALRQVLAATPCTTAVARVPAQGPVQVIGLIGNADAGDVRRRLAALVSPRVLEWRVSPVNAVFCDALGAVRASSPDETPPVLTLAGGRTALHDGDRIRPVVTMPGFGGDLRVDYIVHDGSLVHLYPTVADPAQHVAAVPARVLRPRERLSLGDGGDGQPVWAVGPPYGTDMILAVAASVPLLAQPPAQNAEDSGADYLRQLAAAIEAARAKGARVSSSLIPVETLAK